MKKDTRTVEALIADLRGMLDALEAKLKENGGVTTFSGGNSPPPPPPPK